MELMHFVSYLGAQEELAHFVTVLNIYLNEESKKLKEDPGGGRAAAGLDAALSRGDEGPIKKPEMRKTPGKEAEEMQSLKTLGMTAIKLGLAEPEKFGKSELKETGTWPVPSKETFKEEKQDVNFYEVCVTRAQSFY